MNVYVAELARHLARAGHTVDVFTRADAAAPPVDLEPGGGRARVHQVPVAGPAIATKEDLPRHLPLFAAAVLAAAGPVEPDRPPYDVVHGHYWLSGDVAVTLANAWHVPVVQTMHTSAAAKDAARPQDITDREAPEPAVRLAGERRLVGVADALVVSTRAEADELARWYAADPARIHVVPPGVDGDLFAPTDEAGRVTDRVALGLSGDARVVLFVGRIQPHKGPELLVEAVARMVGERPQVRDGLVLAVLGGPSGDGTARPSWIADLAERLGIADLLLRRGPVGRAELARWYRAADVVAVPSRHESFGLVALEAQACGTPVLAARVGGLVDAVDDGVSGVLVRGRDPEDWSAALAGLLTDPARRDRLGTAGRRHALRFAWPRTAERTAAVYASVLGGGGAPRNLATEALEVVTRWLDEAGIAHEPGTRPGEVVAVLPGERRLSTPVSLLVGPHTVSLSAFVCRRPDEAIGDVHDLLLRRNARSAGVAFAVDRLGDIYLTARLATRVLASSSAYSVLDDVLGAVSRTVEETFDTILSVGFASAIRAEHAWRVSRGMPVDNLAAFRRVIDRGPAAGSDRVEP
jgi:D-inositol-3-phosphate glycosyltransferase